MVQDHARLEVRPIAAPLEGNALAQGVDVGVDRVRDSLGTGLDGDNPIAELGGYITGEALEQRPKVVESQVASFSFK